MIQGRLLDLMPRTGLLDAKAFKNRRKLKKTRNVYGPNNVGKRKEQEKVNAHYFRGFR